MRPERRAPRSPPPRDAARLLDRAPAHQNTLEEPRGPSARRDSLHPSKGATIVPEFLTSTHSLGRLWRRRVAVAGTTAALIGALALAIFSSPASATAPSAPPPVTILTSTGNLGPGDIFVTPTGDPGTYANGPEILDQHGNLVWFRAIPQGQTAADFRTQTYLGQPVLTWWQGTGPGGLSSGTDYIYNDRFRQIATVNAGNGLSADGHEFVITPWNTALILAYTTATEDLSSIGGPADQTVINGVVQEIDIATGKVLFRWNSADHVPFSESEQSLPSSPATPWDWFHINAVKLDTDGNLLIDARNTWTTYKVTRSRATSSGNLAARIRASRWLPPRVRCSTAPARSSPGNTIPSRSVTATTPSSTTSPRGVHCSPTAEPSL
jgi:Arylsulfotransferase (ASST)